MDAGPDFTYMWPHETKKKLVELSAPDYISRLMDWIEAELDDPALFPEDVALFPENYQSRVKKIYKRLFRVYAHCFHRHFYSLKTLRVSAHWTTALKHYVTFCMAHKLISDSELQPLKPLLDKLLN